MKRTNVNVQRGGGGSLSHNLFIFIFFCSLQVNLIITLSMGSTESDRVISELCYNEAAYNRHIVK